MVVAAAVVELEGVERQRCRRCEPRPDVGVGVLLREGLHLAIEPDPEVAELIPAAIVEVLHIALGVEQPHRRTDGPDGVPVEDHAVTTLSLTPRVIGDPDGAASRRVRRCGRGAGDTSRAHASCETDGSADRDEPAS